MIYLFIFSAKIFSTICNRWKMSCFARWIWIERQHRFLSRRHKMTQQQTHCHTNGVKDTAFIYVYKESFKPFRMQSFVLNEYKNTNTNISLFEYIPIYLAIYMENVVDVIKQHAFGRYEAILNVYVSIIFTMTSSVVTSWICFCDFTKASDSFLLVILQQFM